MSLFVFDDDNYRNNSVHTCDMETPTGSYWISRALQRKGRFTNDRGTRVLLLLHQGGRQKALVFDLLLLLY